MLRLLAALAVLSATPAPACAQAAQPVPSAQLTGQVSREAIASRPLEESRDITVYLPPGWAAGQTYPVVYMADGQAAGAVIRVLDPLIRSGKVAPVVLVGLHSANDGNRRHLEYSATLDRTSDPAFGRHMRFFLQEVMPLAEAKYGASTRPADRLLLGFSDGASWAVETALREPRRFGRVAALSLGVPKATPTEPGVRPKFWLGCGTDEGPFRIQTSAFASEARSRGYNVRFTVHAGVHGQALWTPMYADVLQWAFGRPGP